MDNGSPPQAPDPAKTAAAQYQENLKSAQATTALNRPDQITPWGTLHWQQAPSTKTFNQSKYDAAQSAYNNGSAGGGINPADPLAVATLRQQGIDPTTYSANAGATAPDRNDAQFYDETPSNQWTSTTTLDPKYQGILDSLTGQAQQVLGPDGTTADRSRVEDSLYGQYTRTLDPQFAERERATKSDLVNRGFMEGTEAYDRELKRMSMDRNDAYQVARTASVQAGGAEQDRQRNGILAAMSSFRNGSTPQFANGASGAGVAAAPIGQYEQNAYQSQLAGYNADVAGSNALIGLAGTIGGAMIGGPTGAAIGGGLAGNIGGSSPVQASPAYTGSGGYQQFRYGNYT